MRKGLGRHNYRSAGGPVPSLVLDFAGTGTLDPRVTFTRSTTGTYYNSSGVLSTAAINAPRFDYNPSTLAPLGLLIEQSSTNLLLQSQTFTNASWTKTNCTAVDNVTVAPDGTTTAATLTTSGSPPVGAYCVQTTSSTTGTISIYAKANTSRYLIIVHGTYASGDWAVFDLIGGTVTQSPTYSGSTVSMLASTNGFYRCILNSSQLATIVAFTVSGASTGNATASSGNLYIWGAQLEALAFPTSYIPTTSAQVTRASDNASMTGTNFSSWYNQSQGTFYAESSTADTFPTTFAVGDTTANNRIQVGLCPIAGLGLRSYVITNGVQQNNVTVGNYTLRSFAKIALSCISGAFTGAFNGTASSTATGNMPVCTQATIGQANYTGQYQNGTIKKIAYYPVTLTNAQLQSLTGS